MIVLLRYVHIFYALIGFKLKKKTIKHFHLYIQINTNVYDPYICISFIQIRAQNRKKTYFYVHYRNAETFIPTYRTKTTKTKTKLNWL